MSKRNKFTEEIVEGLCKDQNISEGEVEIIREKYANLPDGIFLGFLLRHFIDRPDRTNWKSMLGELELILLKNQDEEQMRLVTQHILEGFSNLISNKVFEPRWIQPYLGPLSRKYLNDYEKWHGSSTRY